MVDWLGRYIDAGATGFVVVPPADSLDSCVDYLRAYAAEVMPLLNQRSGVDARPRHPSRPDAPSRPQLRRPKEP